MTSFEIRKLWRTGVAACMAALLPLLFCSCEPFFEDEEDCTLTYRVRFRHTMNILEADAFSSRVKSVSLFVFDRSGRLVASKTESGEALTKEGYAMEIDVEPGTYDLIAWGGLEGSESFSLLGGSHPESKEELVAVMSRLHTRSAWSASALTPLFHAMEEEVDFPDTFGDHVVATLDLTKDTNTVRIILQHYGGKVLDKDDFSFVIMDDNGRLNYDNLPLADEVITYTEWSKQVGEVSSPLAEDGATVTAISSVIAEIDVSRLMKTHSPVLTVLPADGGAPVLRLPLNDLLIVAKGEARRPMSDQEYLDRQDEYNLVFFINDENGWYKGAGIYVNSWHLMLQSAEM